MKTVLYFIGGCITAIFLLPIPQSSLQHVVAEPIAIKLEPLTENAIIKQQEKERDSLIILTKAVLIESLAKN